MRQGPALRFRESQDLKFRAEFFNFLNYPSFAQPDLKRGHKDAYV